MTISTVGVTYKMLDRLRTRISATFVTQGSRHGRLCWRVMANHFDPLTRVVGGVFVTSVIFIAYSPIPAFQIAAVYVSLSSKNA